MSTYGVFVKRPSIQRMLTVFMSVICYVSVTLCRYHSPMCSVLWCWQWLYYSLYLCPLYSVVKSLVDHRSYQI